MLKRLMLLMMALCLLFSALPAAGEEIQAGAVWQEINREDFSLSSPALYTAKLRKESSLFSQRDVNGGREAYMPEGAKLDVLYVGSTWVVARYGKNIGYIKRDRLTSVTAVDPVNTPPYGMQKAIYVATTADTCPVRKSMSETDESWVVLNPGTKLSIWKIQDGWAVVLYWRTYGYINMNHLTDLIPVSPTDEPINEETPIAAYTSFYTVSDDELILGRIHNLRVACEYLNRVMQPGEELDFNEQIGPFGPQKGYRKAIVFIDGGKAPGYGGGVCQVSSTLYNALLQLPQIEVLYRRSHGPGEVEYLPHGVDASVGTDLLNFRFRNDYDFPIRIEGHTSDDGALLMLVYKVTE